MHQRDMNSSLLNQIICFDREYVVAVYCLAQEDPVVEHQAAQPVFDSYQVMAYYIYRSAMLVMKMTCSRLHTVPQTDFVLPISSWLKIAAAL